MQPMIKIIDNKKISLMQAEWDLYQSIARSYDRPNFKGEELFKGLFETDDEGIIVFLIPPTSKYTSMEVYLFVVNIYLHQYVRKAYSQIQGLMNEVRAKLKEVK